MDLKKITTIALAKEFIKEDEYLKNISYNDIDNDTYNTKMEYLQEVRKELFNRGFYNYKDIQVEAEKELKAYNAKDTKEVIKISGKIELKLNDDLKEKLNNKSVKTIDIIKFCLDNSSLKNNTNKDINNISLKELSINNMYVNNAYFKGYTLIVEYK